MEYIYSAMVLYSAGKDITEDAIKAVLTAAGVDADAAKIKALVASLEGVDIKEAIASAAVAAPAAVAARSRSRCRRRRTCSSRGARRGSSQRGGGRSRSLRSVRMNTLVYWQLKTFYPFFIHMDW